MMRWIRPSCVLLLTIIFAACSSIPKLMGPRPTELQLTIRVEANANPDDNGRPSPVVLNLYQLKSDGIFSNSDYLSLYSSASSKLGNDLITTQKLAALPPGSVRKEVMTLDAGTNQLGVLAEFVEFNNLKGKLTIPIKANSKNVVTLRVDASGLRIQTDD